MKKQKSEGPLIYSWDISSYISGRMMQMFIHQKMTSKILEQKISDKSHQKSPV